MSLQPDAALLVAARAGEPAAMQRLLTELCPNIRQYAAYRCGRATAVDDVVQEALIIVHRHVAALRHASAFPGWLATIVARLCLLPAMQLFRATEALAHAEHAAEVARRPPEQLRSDVSRALESLPEAYREVILMRDFEELTIGEMASKLSLTREATKSRLHRARAMVREYLSDD